MDKTSIKLGAGQVWTLKALKEIGVRDKHQMMLDIFPSRWVKETHFFITGNIFKLFNQLIIMEFCLLHNNRIGFCIFCSAEKTLSKLTPS